MPEPAHSHERILKTATGVGMATLISRVFGYFRDAALAWILGAGYGMDVFTVAYRLANLFRRLVGEGAMSAAFIPVFVQYRTEKSEQELWHFARKGFYALAVTAGLLVALEMIFMPWVVHVIAPGFQNVGGKLEFTILLTRIMAPYLFFVSLAAYLTGILNSFHSFLIPALSPVFFNLAVIASAWTLARWMPEPAIGVAFGVLIGGMVQFLIQIPRVRKQGMSFKPAISFKDPGIQKMGRLLGPSIVGLGVVQLNIFVDSMMASFLREGSVSQIYYANRVLELVLGIFVLSISTVILPELSKFAAQKNMEEVKRKIEFSMCTIFSVSFPATIGLFILSEPIIHVLFERGRFTAVDTERTAVALAYYALGLFFISAVRVIVSAFYAVQDTKTPVKSALLSLGVNIVLNLILMHPLKQGGIALATSIASAVNLLQLVFIFQKHHGRFAWDAVNKSLLKVAAASMGMGISILGVLNLLSYHGSTSFQWQACALFLTILISMAVYLGLCFVFRCEEVILFVSMGFKGKKKD